MVSFSLGACGASPIEPKTDRATSTAINVTVAPTIILPTPFTKPGAAVADFQHRWLRGEPCSAPCWEGIIPGRTTVTEAVDILNRSSLITGLQNSYRVSPDDDDTVTWLWMNPKGSAGGSLAYPQHPSAPVTTIHVAFPNTSFRFRDVIAAYGNPSYVLPFSDSGPVGGNLFASMDW